MGRAQDKGLLPNPQSQAAFEEGVKHLFRRWTALNLAVENQWGGANSAEKANWLVEDTIEWFRINKGAAGGTLNALRIMGGWTRAWAAGCDGRIGHRSRWRLLSASLTPCRAVLCAFPLQSTTGTTLRRCLARR